jgi:hypothetical protein
MTGKTGIPICLWACRLNTYVAVIEKLHPVKRLHQILVKRVIQQVPISMGHEILPILFLFNWMAGGTVLRGDNNMHLIAVVFEGVAVFFRVQGVTLSAADYTLHQVTWNPLRGDPSFQFRFFQRFKRTHSGMAATLPTSNHPWRYTRMAV